MLTAENCRSKAAEFLGAAESATDPKTSASLRRTAELWTALALQIEESLMLCGSAMPNKSRISCGSA